MSVEKARQILDKTIQTGMPIGVAAAVILGDDDFPRLNVEECQVVAAGYDYTDEQIMDWLGDNPIDQVESEMKKFKARTTEEQQEILGLSFIISDVD